MMSNHAKHYDQVVLGLRNLDQVVLSFAQHTGYSNSFSTNNFLRLKVRYDKLLFVDFNNFKWVLGI